MCGYTVPKHCPTEMRIYLKKNVWKKYIKNLPKLTPAGKKALLKYGAVLLFIILGFSLLSRALTHNGQTLAQYGEANPSLQGSLSVSGSDAAPAGGDTADTSADSAGEKNAANRTDADDEQEDNGQEHEDTAWQVSADGLTGNGGTESPKRVTYKPDFYYEPLSENLIGYITGCSYPDDGSAEISLSELNYVHILHYDFEGNIAEGELICNSAIAQDLVEIFYELYTAEYQLERVLLIDYYNADDTTSMMANNTSCFNYRNIDDTDKLSRHAFGLAIDVNPFYNPYIRFTKDGGQIISPESSEAYADRTQSFPYKIDADDLCCRLFLEHGFTWGGNWNSSKDYQHFQKIID